METRTIQAGDWLPGRGRVAYGQAVIVYATEASETASDVAEKAVQLLEAHRDRIRRQHVRKRQEAAEQAGGLTDVEDGGTLDGTT